MPRILMLLGLSLHKTIFGYKIWYGVHAQAKPRIFFTIPCHNQPVSIQRLLERLVLTNYLQL